MILLLLLLLSGVEGDLDTRAGSGTCGRRQESGVPLKIFVIKLLSSSSSCERMNGKKTVVKNSATVSSSRQRVGLPLKIFG